MPPPPPTSLPSTRSPSTTTATLPVQTTDEGTATPPSPPSPPSSAQIGTYVGIAVGGVALLILAVVVLIILVCICLRASAGTKGFYKTEEINGKAGVSMVRYSASLRQIESEKVMVEEMNGISPLHSRTKEFYM